MCTSTQGKREIWLAITSLSRLQDWSWRKCVKDVIKSTELGITQIKRDGTEYKLNILINFDGKAGFDVDVYLNDKLEVNGKYSPPTGNKYVASKYFYFKHGVYSKNIFDYVLESKISVNKVN